MPRQEQLGGFFSQEFLMLKAYQLTTYACLTALCTFGMISWDDPNFCFLTYELTTCIMVPQMVTLVKHYMLAISQHTH